MKGILTAAITGVLLLGFGARPADASSITVSGSTLGCFGTGCTTYTATPYSGSTYDLTFFGTTFSTVTDPSGSSTLTLGSFGRGNTNVSSSEPALSFTLQVTFTVPVGIGGSPSTFTALISGTNSGGGGAESIVFSNPTQVFSYSNSAGSGSFTFSVATSTLVGKNTMLPNGTPVALTGAITNATFTPTSTPPTSPVPEPGTLLLLGTGLAVLAHRVRRARQ
jgi:hypothetical protein